MSDNKNNNEWAKDTIEEVIKDDPLRILDIENDTQMLLSKLGAPSETERASSNYNKLVYDEPRPASHHITEAVGRLLPNVVFAGGPIAVKLGANALKKGGKDFLKKLAASRMKKAALKKAQKGIGDENKTLVKVLTTFFKNSPQRTRDFADIYEKQGLKTIADKVRAFDTSIEGVIHSRLKNMPGDLTTKYNVILNEVPAMSRQTNIPEAEIIKALKREADRLYKEPQLRELNFAMKKQADMRSNPNLYKGLTDEESDILFKNRKAKYFDIGASSAYFNTGLNKAAVATSSEAIPDLVKKAPGVLKDVGAKELALHAPRVVDIIQDKVRYQKPEEKVIRPYMFDKQPDTHPFTDLLKDIAGVDYYNPNRWNQEDVEWFLNEAYEKDLFSDKSWTEWTPRQKILKMKEIVQSPMAVPFMNELRGIE